MNLPRVPMHSITVFSTFLLVVLITISNLILKKDAIEDNPLRTTSRIKHQQTDAPLDGKAGCALRVYSCLGGVTDVIDAQIGEAYGDASTKKRTSSVYLRNGTFRI